MAILLVLVAGALALRPLWSPRVPEGVPVEVVGQVERPGWHVLPEPTLAAAVREAGGEAEGLPGTPLHAGDRVVVRVDGVHIAPGGDPLLVAIPVDPNIAGLEALVAVPGLGEKTARAILAEREQGGPFTDLDDLERVPGIGPGTIEEVAPFLDLPAAVSQADAGPVDLNRATAAELEELPGIGPVTASRIVVDREERGPYRRVEDLQRVKGIGPKKVEGIRELVTVAGP